MFAFPRSIVAGGTRDGRGHPQRVQRRLGTVEIYERQAGQTTDTLVATTPLVNQGSSDDSETNSYLFEQLLANLRHNATITAVWAGNDQYLAASASAKVQCLTAHRLHRDQGGRWHPAFQGHDLSGQRRRHRLRAVRRARQAVAGEGRPEAHGRASATWRAPAGHYRFVALFRGNALNAAGASRTITSTVPSGKPARPEDGGGRAPVAPALRRLSQGRYFAAGSGGVKTRAASSLSIS